MKESHSFGFTLHASSVLFTDDRRIRSCYVRPLSLSPQEPAKAFLPWQNRYCGLAGQSTCLVNRRPWVQIPAVPAILYQHELVAFLMADPLAVQNKWIIFPGNVASHWWTANFINAVDCFSMSSVYPLFTAVCVPLLGEYGERQKCNAATDFNTFTCFDLITSNIFWQRFKSPYRPAKIAIADCFQVILAGYWVKFSTSNNHVSGVLHRLRYCLCTRINGSG